MENDKEKMQKLTEEQHIPPELVPALDDPNVPVFEVVQPPGFATGLTVYPPGTRLPWVIPDGWDEKRNGKHYAAYGPSVTFRPVNDAALKMLNDHKEVVRRKNLPPSSEAEALRKQLDKQHESMQQMMSLLMAQNAELRRQNEAKNEAKNPPMPSDEDEDAGNDDEGHPRRKKR